jgi:RND family efflux transporter MFP subunit
VILRCAFWLACAAVLAGCRDDGAAEAPLLRVRTVTAQMVDFAPSITFTGSIAARVETDLGFRVNGKISERLANVGDHVKAGQLLARLDPEQQEADLVAARAGVSAAEATLRHAIATFDRQKTLLATGNTTRRSYDEAEASLRSAHSQLDQANADLRTAQDQLAYTELRADADGIITRQSAEVGQVVAQAQVVYILARDGPRDAVFNVYELALVHLAAETDLAISLVSDPAVRTVGEVREVSPAVDTRNATVRVKVGLRETPAAMSLGALVDGVGHPRAQPVVMVPWAALFDIAGKPAVWVVDAQTGTVSVKPITIARYTKGTIAVSGGLRPGERVVSAGVQSLRPGQKVEIAPEPKR